MATDLSRYTHIIWDWNGTLLDDAWLCVEVMNGMLRERTLPLISLSTYRNIFDFPVKNYYQQLGFDFAKESFEEVGMEFMNRYNQRQHECKLYPEVKTILTFCCRQGYKQAILSAREQNELVRETIALDVNPFFEKVYGLDDHYAHGKTDVGFRLIQDLGVPKNKLIFIGDTLHDAEVAQEIGIACTLIPNGHHSEERLMTSGFPVALSLTELVNMKQVFR